jgi:hypothetical protein
MKSRPIWILGLLLGIILALGPLWSAALSTLFMTRAFDSLNSNGITDPQHLANEIGHTLVFTGLGVLACPIGIVIAIVSFILLLRSWQSPSSPVTGSSPKF